MTISKSITTGAERLKGAVVVFVNGFWGSGDEAEQKVSFISRKWSKKLKDFIGNHIGANSGREYWDERFIEKAHDYFLRKDCTGHIEDVGYLFLDGRNIWNSSGQLRWVAGYNMARESVYESLIGQGVTGGNGIQRKKLFFISHSMGAAYAEGVIFYLSLHRMRIDKVLHFSAADNRDFEVTLPDITYQVHIGTDMVLAWKRDLTVLTHIPRLKTEVEKFASISRHELYHIKNLIPSHFIACSNGLDVFNHVYTKTAKVWEMIEFPE